MNSLNINKLPNCVGFIMDGNRRWAKETGVPSLMGHLAGKDAFFEVVGWVFEMKIPHAIFYAFSTENWKREKSEVEGLMSLFSASLKAAEEKFKDKKIAVRVVGRKEDFSESMQEEIKELEDRNSYEKPTTTIWITLSYGGRAEILDAVNKAIGNGVAVDEAVFSKLLWTAGMPDPDLIIRTGGEERLSNFLPWQTIYSELFFTKTLWPAFTKEEFTRILNEYGERERRIGK